MEKENLMLRKRGGFDELYTPTYAVEVLKKFGYDWDKKKVLCPFDDASSNYVKVLRSWGCQVDYSHQWDGKDFFDYTIEEVEKYDYIISNPPYSLKDKVLEHLYKLGRPFMMLLPISTLEGIKRGKMFADNGVDLIVLNRRINFMEQSGGKSSYFNTSYFCWKVLDQSKNGTVVFADMERNKND